jgi:hypothetical protein
LLKGCGLVQLDGAFLVADGLVDGFELLLLGNLGSLFDCAAQLGALLGG